MLLETGKIRFVFLCIILGILLYICAVSLNAGEATHVDSFDLKAEDGKLVTKAALEPGKITLIFVFSRTCLSCEPNRYFWNKLSKLAPGKSRAYGIILDGPEKLIRKPGEVRFSLYFPLDKERFKKEFDIAVLPKTIVLEGGKIIYIQDGLLNGNAYFEIKKTIGGLNEEL